MSDSAVSDRGWRIAPITPDDADELGAVHVEVWRQTYAGIMPADFLAGLDPQSRADRWRAIASSPREGSQTLVARGDDGRLLGFVSVGPSRDDDPPTDTELYVINLLSEAHGTGLGQSLLDEALGDEDATLWVAEDNSRARAFYVRNGFVPEGARSRHEATGAPEIRMIRRRQGASPVDKG